ncbi:hypothetical protein LX16_5184 [Stackebrandtia albiflava]|uniref:Uncharacterized protein n=1 Tax=Stackebrandtia albiflava TaxID=406432 RepID=A0A562ULF2_9ACTN|nr:hypothetical protein LX16_5184 [Stackebrandtia albiflava]
MDGNMGGDSGAGWSGAGLPSRPSRRSKDSPSRMSVTGWIITIGGVALVGGMIAWGILTR